MTNGTNSSSRPLTALIILDGWGISSEREGNAVLGASTPYLDSLFAQYPHTRLACQGEAVGLPAGQMGNSEVGHLNIGSGRVVYQDISRINRAIADGSIKYNPALNKAIEAVKQNRSVLHLIGLVSSGGVHSDLGHLRALIKLACEKGAPRVALHAHLDGRDTPPDSGAGYVREILDYMSDYPQCLLASLGGRFWGMDRDKRWQRVQKSWQAIVGGQGKTFIDPVDHIRKCYEAGEFDEFITPAVGLDEHGAPLARVGDGDAVIYFNFRADRARELTWAFNDPGFSGFAVPDRPKLAAYVTMTEYDEHLPLAMAFPPQELHNTLAEVLSRAGKKQLHIAETEKYAHVTFFFNGGRESPWPGEDRVLIPSPSEVETYDQKPAMSALEVSEEVLKRVAGGEYDFMVLNYANCDMVGHTGVYEAARQAVETVDQCLSRVIPAVLQTGGKGPAHRGSRQRGADDRPGQRGALHRPYGVQSGATDSGRSPAHRGQPERRGPGKHRAQHPASDGH